MLNLTRFASFAMIFVFLISCSTTFKNEKATGPGLQSNPGQKTDRTSKQANVQDEELTDIEKVIDADHVRLPIERNPNVEKWIRYFQTTAHRSFITWKERGEPFRKSIEQALVQEGVPGELYYLSLIESGFVHNASSTASAVGPWQFVKETGLLYGLKVNDWIDQRRDPVHSTLAAAALLRDLNSRYGDWYLAIAAYNSGPRRIDDAIKKGKTKDFWELKRRGLLKKETGEFVPKLLAAVIVGSDPLQFGFPAKLIQAHEDFPQTVITIKRPIKIEELSKKLEISVDQIKKWNPELLRGITPPKRFLNGKGYALRMAEPYVKRFAQVEGQLNYLQVKDIRIHKIAKGDTIAKLAKRYHVSVQTVMQINPQLSSRGIVLGMKVAMPVPESPS